MAESWWVTGNSIGALSLELVKRIAFVFTPAGVQVRTNPWVRQDAVKQMKWKASQANRSLVQLGVVDGVRGEGHLAARDASIGPLC